MKMILFCLCLASIHFLQAQEVIQYHGKSITIQGPKCFSMEINGTTLEYHQKIVDNDLYVTVLRKRGDGVIHEINVRKVSVKVITDNVFKIDYLNTYGEMYSCKVLTDLNKVLSTVYEKSGGGSTRETNITIYFSNKQQLVDFIEEIKKKRGF